MKNTLSKRTSALISMGVNMSGSYEDAYMFIEEQLYCDEAESVDLFCQWLQKNRQRKNLPLFVEENYSKIYKNYFLKEVK